MHQLDIVISDSGLNPRAFRVEDNSAWDKSLPIKNIILEITPPGFHHPLHFRENEKFSHVFNANLLRLNTGGYSSIPSLPDGIYEVKLSVAPNEDVNVLYYYLRNVKQDIKYRNILSQLLSGDKRYSSKLFKAKQESISWIYQKMLAAKFMAQDKHDLHKAMELYYEVDINLDKFEL